MQLAQSLAQTPAGQRICTNASHQICFTNTLQPILPARTSPPAAQKVQEMPMAPMVIYLCGDLASQITAAW